MSNQQTSETLENQNNQTLNNTTNNNNTNNINNQNGNNNNNNNNNYGSTNLDNFLPPLNTTGGGIIKLRKIDSPRSLLVIQRLGYHQR